MAKAFVDKGLEKVLSRKLLVWATATGLAAANLNNKILERNINWIIAFNRICFVVL
jgi:hypothetical protein